MLYRESLFLPMTWSTHVFSRYTNMTILKSINVKGGLGLSIRKLVELTKEIGRLRGWITNCTVVLFVSPSRRLAIGS